jgi:hypothetical protein
MGAKASDAAVGTRYLAMVPDAHPMATPPKSNRKSPSLSFLVAEAITA